MSLTERIKELEDKKQNLLTLRRQQIFSLLEQTSMLDIDDSSLAGALLYIKEHKADSSNNLIAQFKELAKKHKIRLPSRSRETKKPVAP